MGEFKRSPSKVWWANEQIEWRENSSSPGSQDSGFSDTENSPPIGNANQTTPNSAVQRISKEIFKELADRETNLTRNFREKSTPNKASVILVKSETKSKRPEENVVFQSEPMKKCTKLYTKHSPKVSRNLFNTKIQKDVTVNQYSKQDASDEEDCNNVQAISLPCFNSKCTPPPTRSANKSLPIDFHRKNANLLDIEKLREFRDDEGVTSFNNSLSSDCESELECLFDGNSVFDTPKHTSTPKMHQFKRHVSRERVEKVHTDCLGEQNGAVRVWMDEIKRNYEQECMTTLQCKSIAVELNLNVQQIAVEIVRRIKDVLEQARTIVREYLNLNSEQKHIGPLIQSLTGSILDYIKTHKSSQLHTVTNLVDDIRTSSRDGALKLVGELFACWQAIQESVLAENVKEIVERVERPKNEIDLRAAVTAVTSLTLRNEDLVDYFTKFDLIPILLIFCEKCEGSTMRSLILRALSTVCINSYAVRQFEKCSGVQIISDAIANQASPEPERAEAIALLAQVTAPWLEDNHCVKGLQDYANVLVKSLTDFVRQTKCCQNLLLATAALANLSAMDARCLKCMVQCGTVAVVLDVVARRGPMVSMYVYEQVATLLANLSGVETARNQMIAANGVAALLRFLHIGCEEVAKRVQQKAIIALSRVCGDKEAARQCVDCGGVERLVKICREKGERFDSDAVLVAALATLRKIADSCGGDVMKAEDAQELVEPKLLDSFLAYSSQNESYV